MLDLILENVQVIKLATKTNFRSVTSREVALIEGHQGWGEFSPFLEYGASESVPWLVSAVEAAIAPIDVPLRKSIPINGTLPAVNGALEIIEILNFYPGAKVIKIKVGNNLEEDLKRLALVREIAPDLEIRLDANGLWSVDAAEIFINKAGPIQYIEQPCATIEELRELRRRVSVRIAGDEIIRKAKDPFDVDLTGAVDILMLKVAPLGGIAIAKKIAAHHGLPVVVSSALESAVGISHGLKLAASIVELNFACGLATGKLLKEDVAALPLINGEIAVASVIPDTKNFSVSPERLKWWKDRIRQTWQAGARERIEESGWSW